MSDVEYERMLARTRAEVSGAEVFDAGGANALIKEVDRIFDFKDFSEEY